MAPGEHGVYMDFSTDCWPKQALLAATNIQCSFHLITVTMVMLIS